ncbi:DUF2141 domain-containing protein [Qipengyuania sp. 1NDH17]|uniref:DUF2141 domain-containing protein n=1 Tax=Qipengyuania polymorpha TaxID=2867234 RepID=A0ABS7IYM0_9SPHN|nr:DUF2141 domain-containing protein [Qipengyuania polymorpha]MBX7458661.1 DUF2141 domain-containing protein [Qipengyuania polymorpha]
MIRAALLPVAALALGAGAPAPEAGSTITVTVTNLRNADGVVLACMTTSDKSFPKCRGVEGAKSAKVAAHEGTLTVTFTDVKPGRYAIALLHDENANGKADRALGMMPKEGFGFSRDAPVRMGPPSFKDAVFDMADEDRAMTIKMRYML